MPENTRVTRLFEQSDSGSHGPPSPLYADGPLLHVYERKTSCASETRYRIVASKRLKSGQISSYSDRKGRPYTTRAAAERDAHKIETDIRAGIPPRIAFSRHTNRKYDASRTRAPLGSQPPWKEEYRRRLYTAAKYRAKSIGVPFSITPEHIIIPDHCPVLGVKLEPTSPGVKNQHSCPSLDRLIPARGYVPGNVVVMSWRANRIKWNSTAAELRALADWLDYIEHCPPLVDEDTGARWEAGR